MHTDFLFIIAEIAAAFAGFASLVAVLTSRGDRSAEQRQFEFVTLQNVLLLSLLTIAFSLLPNLLERQAAIASYAWRVSSAAFLLAVGAYVAFTLGRLPRAYGAIGRAVPWSFRVNAGMLMASVVAQAFAVAGLLPASIYLVGLALLLYCAGFGFVRLFVSLRPGG